MMNGSPGALVIAGHGSHVNPDSATPVYDHADTIREMDLFDEVRETFWKEEPSFREVLRTVESDVVTVVPLFTSEGYFTERVIPRELRLADGWELDVDLEVNYAAPVGTHQAMAAVIVERAESVTGDSSVGDGFGLAVVGHGTDRHENSGRSTRAHAVRIRERDLFDEVQALFMDEQPYIDDVTDRFESEDIVVVPLFIADGYHTKEDLPEDMGLTDDYRTGYEIPAAVDGHRIWYAGAVGTEPLMAELILQRAVEAGVSLDRDGSSGIRRPRAAGMDGPR